MSGPLLLGIDIGTSRTKALLVDEAGREVGEATVLTPFVTTGDRTEATVADLVRSLAQILDRLGDDRGRIAAVGVAGVAESGAPLDAHGRPLAPVLAWHDRRGEEVAARLNARFGPDLSRRIGHRIRYVSSVAKLGWHLDHRLADGDGRGPTAWLGVPELCLFALTGVQATELSLASRTGCFDIGMQTWMSAVADEAGFDVAVFPQVLRAGTDMGHVIPAAAAWSGLPMGVPVTIAGHDHLVGVLGSGATALDLANSVGTAETVIGRSTILPDLAGAVEQGVTVGIFPGGGGCAVQASAARAGLAVDDAAARLGMTPAELDALAAAVANTRRPDALSGRPGTPGEAVEAPGLLDSLRRREPPALPDGADHGDVWATLLDMLATCTGEAIDAVTSILGPRRRLVVFGGGSASRPWLAAKARQTTLPVWRSTSRQAVARGAAVLAGVAAGWWLTADDGPTLAPEPIDLRDRIGR